MIDVLNLALPFFGLIFLGFACGKLKQIPDTGARLDELLHRLRVAAGAVLSHPGARRRSSSWPTSLHSGDDAVDLLVPSRCRFRHRHADPRRPHRRSDDRGPGRRLRQYRLHGAGAGAGDAGRAGGGAGRADLLFRHAAAVLAGAVPDGGCRPGEKERRADRLRSRQAHRACIRSSSRPRSAWRRRRSISSRRWRSTG